MEGRNAAFEQIFENVYDFGTGLTTGWSDGIASPLWYRQPDLGEARVIEVAKVETAIEQLAQADRDRVRLSLRWHRAATYDDGVDALLKEWIALETLAMPDTDIRPLVGIIAGVYGLEPREASERFAIGRIYGLRSHIVHAGRVGPVPARLLDHMANLYSDALCAILDVPSPHRAAETADDARMLIAQDMGL
jgi:hypothetical protein